MNKTSFFLALLSFSSIILLAINASEVNDIQPRACSIGGGKYLYLYKRLSLRGESWKVSSKSTCVNLISNTTQFLSGQADGSWTCMVYSNNNCRGQSVGVGKSGRNFGFSGKSLKCPC